ncbi:MFS transporter [Lacticaseibacillus paracasei]|jgi:ACS family glucarate transporter-like MFS transporter|uniref:MFS transporter n=1 Tax=Lacticaseibacillus paracasei TaxID=1597 RepID=UPI000667BDBA|nr:MFS transporter [Lacticaseibacillus paracasei]MCL4175913.1 MFS transporter [Lacticaseibacillus paracasei]MCO7166455.1 MFS transporter [Lacticaseibacillus paracasei]MDB7799513.1 MFS transporter [Lacticaseibacillus paracasei]MDB7802060.1 MFS transporter [Lacticaseibacillus paracasei]MDB7812729.1 MFS transporter [Lacticaseibacillus paracasei]
MMDAKPNRRALSLGSFVILYLGYMLLFADRTVLNLSLAAIGKDFSVSPAALGATSSVFFLGYTIMQIPGGWLTDRFSSRKVIIATLAFWSVMTIFTGLAWSLAALLVIRFLFGIAEGPYPPAAMKQVAQDFPLNKRAQLTAALISSNYAGAALAPFIIVPIIAATGWRSAFFWLGAFGLLLMVIYLFFRGHGGGQAVTKQERQKISWKEIDPRVWAFVVIGLALNIITKGMETWMPVYFLNARHINLANLAWLVPLPTIAGGIAALISGYVMVHIFKNHERLMIILASFLTVLTMFGLYKSTSLVWLVIFQMATYFVKSLAFTGIFSYAAQLFPQKTYGSQIGTINFGGQLGGFFGPLLIGWIVQLSGSYDTAFFGLVISALVAGVASIFVGNLKAK